MFTGATLAVSAVLFAIGTIGVLLRRNAIVIFMCIELMLNAVNLMLVAFNRWAPENHAGQIFAFFVIAVAAAEAAVGLAIVISLFRLTKTVHTDQADKLKH
jgi:NADH-quinone oxidoreductase subunit K